MDKIKQYLSTAFFIIVPILLVVIVYQNYNATNSNVKGTSTSSVTSISTSSSIDPTKVQRTTMISKRFATGFEDDKFAFSTKIQINQSVDINDIDAVFKEVIGSLKPEVNVVPSENYFYFRFQYKDSDFWGNIRLAVADRDQGVTHFAYYEYNEDPQGPDDFYSKYKSFTTDDKPILIKVSDLKYKITLDDKTVIFNLATIPSEFDKTLLTGNEKFVMNTIDESGLHFNLLYNGANSFMWLLDESLTPKESLALKNLDENTLIDTRTKFVFYKDKNVKNRKILIGVNSTNIKRNSYFDGPFDQLGENFMSGSDTTFKSQLESAYKYAVGYLDNYGKFVGSEESRMAITPYYNYETESEMTDVVKTCMTREKGNALYTCLAYDYKSRI